MTSRIFRVIAAAIVPVAVGCMATTTFKQPDINRSVMGGYGVVGDAPVSAPVVLAAPGRSVPEAVLAADQAAPAMTAKRIVIYSAVLNIVVSNLSAAIEQVNATATTAGGYMQEQDASSITIRVPAAKFEEMIKRLSNLGEVTNKQVKAADITEEMLDIQIRLDNAMKTRDRLLKLLAESTKTEDTLKIETELGRLTTTIEQIKGRQRFLEQQVALSTIRIAFNSPVPQQAQSRLPFPWISALGDSLVTGQAEANPRSDSFFNRGVRFDLPKSYVRYYVDDDHTEVMSATGLLVKVLKHDNYDRANIDFWADLVRRSLVEHRGIAITEAHKLQLDAGAQAILLVGTRSVGGQPQGYLLLIAANNDDVITFEFWGAAALFNADRAALEKTARSIRLKA